MSEWKPIETAPKDCAFSGFQRLTDELYVIAPMYWSGTEFVILQYHCDNTEHTMRPTHWMEIPTPPKENK